MVLYVMLKISHAKKIYTTKLSDLRLKKHNTRVAIQCFIQLVKEIVFYEIIISKF